MEKISHVQSKRRSTNNFLIQFPFLSEIAKFFRSIFIRYYLLNDYHKMRRRIPRWNFARYACHLRDERTPRLLRSCRQFSRVICQTRARYHFQQPRVACHRVRRRDNVVFLFAMHL